MYSTTRGSIYEIWDEVSFNTLKDTIRQAEEYPDQEVIVYDEDSQPVIAWIDKQATYIKEVL